MSKFETPALRINVRLASDGRAHILRGSNLTILHKTSIAQTLSISFHSALGPALYAPSEGSGITGNSYNLLE